MPCNGVSWIRQPGGTLPNSKWSLQALENQWWVLRVNDSCLMLVAKVSDSLSRQDWLIGLAWEKKAWSVRSWTREKSEVKRQG